MIYFKTEIRAEIERLKAQGDLLAADMMDDMLHCLDVWGGYASYLGAHQMLPTTPEESAKVFNRPGDQTNTRIWNDLPKDETLWITNERLLAIIFWRLYERDVNTVALATVMAYGDTLQNRANQMGQNVVITNHSYCEALSGNPYFELMDLSSTFQGDYDWYVVKKKSVGISILQRIMGTIPEDFMNLIKTVALPEV